jgi:hypothetical protein
LTELEDFLKKNNGKMLHNPGEESTWETYPERLTAVIAANGASADVEYLCTFLIHLQTFVKT